MSVLDGRLLLTTKVRVRKGLPNLGGLAERHIFLEEGTSSTKGEVMASTGN